MNIDDNTPPESPREEWLTVKEFAALKRVGVETVRRWVRAGKLEGERTIGKHGHWRIRRPSHAAS